MHPNDRLGEESNNCAVAIAGDAWSCRKRLFLGLGMFFLFLLGGCTWRPDPRYRSYPYSYEPGIRPERFSGEQYGAMDSVTVERFKEQIRLLWQAPYQWGGNSHQGIDCSGLIVNIYRAAADVNLPRTTRDLFGVGADVEDGPLQFADLVFFGLKQRTEPDHVGLYVAHGYFVHASMSAGVKLAKIYDKPFNTHFLGARRFFYGKPLQNSDDIL